MRDITNQDVRNYIEGNANYLLDKIGLLPEEVKTKVEARIAVCKVCSFLIKNEDGSMRKCGDCGCKLPGKAYSLHAICKHGGEPWKKLNNYDKI